MLILILFKDVLIFDLYVNYDISHLNLIYTSNDQPKLP